MTTLAIDGALHIASRRIDSGPTATVLEPWSGAEVGRVVLADEARAEQAVVACLQAVERRKGRSSYERKAVLAGIVREIDARRDAFAELIARESGKPITAARIEVARGISTFELGAEEATRMLGETMPLDVTASTAGYSGSWTRVPGGSGHRPGAVQLSAQPRRSQAGPGAGVRVPRRAQAAAADAAHVAPARGVHPKRRRTGRRGAGAALRHRRRREAGARRPVRDAVLHGERQGGMVSQGDRRTQARAARAGRQRGGLGPRRRGARRRGGAHRGRALSATPGRSASRCSGSTCTGRSPTASSPGWSSAPRRSSRGRPSIRRGAARPR